MTETFFLLACIFGVGSWFIALIEIILMHSFVRFVFNLGIPVIKRTIELPINNFSPKTDLTYKKLEGKFHFTNDNKVYFLSHLFFFELFRFRTPFPLKAVGIIKQDHSIDIVARLPIGTSLFLLFWILGWIVGSIGLGIQSTEPVAIGFGLIGCFFAIILIGISYPIEKNRMEKMIDELKNLYCV